MRDAAVGVHATRRGRRCAQRCRPGEDPPGPSGRSRDVGSSGCGAATRRAIRVHASCGVTGRAACGCDGQQPGTDEHTQAEQENGRATGGRHKEAAASSGQTCWSRIRGRCRGQGFWWQRRWCNRSVDVHRMPPAEAGVGVQQDTAETKQSQHAEVHGVHTRERNITQLRRWLLYNKCPQQ